MEPQKTLLEAVDGLREMVINRDARYVQFQIILGNNDMATKWAGDASYIEKIGLSESMKSRIEREADEEEE